MIEELKEIRKRLDDAVSTQDWWIVKSQMNKLDTIIYELNMKINDDTDPNGSSE